MIQGCWSSCGIARVEGAVGGAVVRVQMGWGIVDGSGVRMVWGIVGGSGVRMVWGIADGSGVRMVWGIVDGSGVRMGWRSCGVRLG